MPSQPERPLPFLAPESVIRELERTGTPCDAQAGSILFARGQASKGVFLLLKGKVVLSAGEDPTRVVRIAESGCLLGLPATVSERPYSLTAEVVVDSCLSLITPTAFRKMLVSNPGIGLAVIKMLADEVSSLRSLTVYQY